MTIQELRERCQGSGSKAPSLASQTLWGRFNRIFSIYATWIFIRLPFTPNQITVFGTIVFLVGCLSFAVGESTYNYIGWGLIVLSFVLDAVDGELARYRNVMKRFDLGGVYVEPVSHDVQYGLMFLPMGFGASAATGSLYPFLFAGIAASCKLMFRLLEFRHTAAMRHIDEVDGKFYGHSTGKKTPATWSYFLYRNVFVVTGMIPMLLIATLLNHIDWFVYFYGTSLFAIWLYLLNRHVRRIWKTAKEKGY